MNPLDELIAIEAIKRTKAEYFRCLDEKDWEGLVRVFTADAETDFRESVEPHDASLLEHDPRRFMETNRHFLTGLTTAHFGYMPRIDILGPDEARGVWSMEDWLWIPADHGALPAGRLHGWGHYHERYARQGGRWLIAATRLTRVHLDFSPAG